MTMVAIAGPFFIVLVAFVHLFPRRKQNAVFAFVIGVIAFVSKWTLIVCSIYFLIWVGMHWSE